MEPKTFDECQQYLQDKCAMEGYKRVLINSEYYRQRVISHKIDDKNEISFISMVKDDDQESLEEFVIKAARSIFAAAEEYARS